MKCFCWNVRGLNGESRQLAVNRWIFANRPLLGGFLETRVKQDNLQDLMNHSFPGWKFDANYSNVADNGRIVVIWNPILSVVTYLKTDQLMLCGVFNPSSNQSFTVAFIYAYNRRVDRISLWNQIKDLASSSLLRNSPWLLLGDFNQFLSVSEIYSLIPNPVSLLGMNEFQECLTTSDLFDLSFRGCLFTWTNKSPSNPKSRKLDRALINESWQDSFPDSNAFFDAPGSSDHSPCLVTITSSTSRRKSRFNFFNFFVTHPDYARLMQAAWQGPVISGEPLFKLYQRLRAAKFCCKSLNQSSFSNIQARTRESFERLESIQRQVLVRPSQELFVEEQEARTIWLQLASAEESFFKQKSRIRWLDEGDANTWFFHKSVKANLSKNIIHFLLDDSNHRIYDPSQLKVLAINYYVSLLGVLDSSVQPLSIAAIQHIHPFRCNSSLASQLSAIPSNNEIRDSVFGLPKNKAPGPDGFTAEFFTSSWDLVGMDLISAVKDFFINKSLPRQVNATVISLIPKVTGAASLSDFRPISLCNTVYKVISRILASRLKSITPEAVQRNQVGFINGRVLCENVLLAAELVTDFHKDGPITRGCLQIDISKAYDSVNWNFISNILQAFELPEIFVSWVMKCITSPYYSIALNGELVGFFPGKKGLRQGDPISSPLFVLAMDILSKNLDLATNVDIFKPHPQCKDPLITHLSFADDVLVFFDGSQRSLQGIMDVLSTFQTTSGLGLNLSKTCLFLDGNNSVLSREMAASFGLTQGSLPVRYLGLPLLPHKLRPQDYQPLIDRVTSRISSWTSRHLSFAGRLQLIRSVIFGIINFWSASFPLPKGCFETLERLCNAFLWSGAPTSARGAKVSWDSMCSPKSAGGLGLRRLNDLNQIFGLKLIWLLFAANGSLWVAWLQKVIIKDKPFWTSDFQRTGSWIWRRLMKLRSLARPFVYCQVQSGTTASFWQDNWTNLGPLIDLTGANGPRVTGISILASVSQSCNADGWLIPRGRHPLLCLLRACLPMNFPIISSLEPDLYLWRNSLNEPPGAFSTSKTWLSLHPPPPSVNWQSSVWFPERIPKHAFIIWLSIRDRLTTRDRLRSWGLNVPSECLLCALGVENRAHLFFNCVFSSEVWQSFFSHEALSPPSLFVDIVSWVRSSFQNGNLKSICKLILHAVVYCLWRERNARLHTLISKSAPVLIKEIQVIIRAKLAGVDRKALLRRTSSTIQQSVRETYLSTWFRFFQH